MDNNMTIDQALRRMFPVGNIPAIGDYLVSLPKQKSCNSFPAILLYSDKYPVGLQCQQLEPSTVFGPILHWELCRVRDPYDQQWRVAVRAHCPHQSLTGNIGILQDFILGRGTVKYCNVVTDMHWNNPNLPRGQESADAHGLFAW